MLPSKTVFVLGAGASFEAGLPVGTTLKKHVAQALDFETQSYSIALGRGDEAIYNQLLRNFQSDKGKYFEAARTIRHGLSLSASIDDFIDAHQNEDITVCGKLAIARSILNAERGSKLYVSPKNIYNTLKDESLEGTWYVAFYRLLTQGLQRKDLETLFDNVTVVSFNYDRCVEHFLTYALAKNYGIQLEESRKLVRKLPILRPYGSVGPYLTDEVKFGAEHLPPLKSVLSNLRTYSEKIEDTEGLAAIQAAVADADVMVFLGNAYHMNNMRLLGPGAERPKLQRIYATRKEISDADLVYVKRRMPEIRATAAKKDNNFHFAQTCADLFDEYWLSLRA